MMVKRNSPVIQVVPFLPEHLETIHVRDEQKGEIPGKVLTDAVTFMVHDLPIAILGYFLIAPRVVQVWAIIGNEISLCPIAFHKQVLHFINWGFEYFTLQRMQMSVKIHYSKAIKWAESLGFKYEGRMKLYHFDGSDCYLFARTVQ